ncbi:MAG: hypothetical protein ACE5H7_09015 [Acidiferrobacterales bacterium]
MAQEERLFEEYLVARVAQAAELAAVAVRAAELAPENERAAMEALRAKENTDAAKVELAAQRVRLARAAAVAKSVSRARERETLAREQEREVARNMMPGPASTVATTRRAPKVNSDKGVSTMYPQARRTRIVQSITSTNNSSASVNTDWPVRASGSQPVPLPKNTFTGVRSHVLERKAALHRNARQAITSRSQRVDNWHNGRMAALKLARGCQVVAKKVVVQGARSMIAAADYTASKAAAVAKKLKKAQDTRRARKIRRTQAAATNRTDLPTGGTDLDQARQPKSVPDSTAKVHAAMGARAAEPVAPRTHVSKSRVSGTANRAGQGVRNGRVVRLKNGRVRWQRGHKRAVSKRQGMNNVGSGSAPVNAVVPTADNTASRSVPPSTHQVKSAPKQHQVPSEAFRAAQAAKIAKAVKMATAPAARECADVCPLCGAMLAASATGCSCGWQVPSANREIAALQLNTSDGIAAGPLPDRPTECPVCTAALAFDVSQCGCGWLVPTGEDELPSVALSSEERTALAQGARIERSEKSR